MSNHSELQGAVAKTFVDYRRVTDDSALQIEQPTCVSHRNLLPQSSPRILLLGGPDLPSRAEPA